MKYGRYGFSFYALGGGNELQLYTHSEFQAKMVAEKLLGRVLALERKYSRYREESIASRINAAAGQEAIRVDDETADLIDFAAMCFQKSRGLFDITSGILRRAWNFKVPRVPLPEELAALVSCIGWDKVEWTRPFLRLPIAGMEIDFGGIGKEYATDILAEMAEEYGIQHGLINLGGDLRVIGPHPDGKPWRLGIRHPRMHRKIVRVFEISKGSLTTSGDYERFFEIEGVRYSHILNPKSGYPSRECRSVTVCTPSCLLAGSLSTISMLLPTAEARALLHQENVDYYLVDAQGACWDRLGAAGSTGELETRMDEEYAR